MRDAGDLGLITDPRLRSELAFYYESSTNRMADSMIMNLVPQYRRDIRGSRHDWNRNCGADCPVDYWPTGHAPDDNRHPCFDPNSDANADWIALAWLATFDFASTDTVKLKQ